MNNRVELRRFRTMCDMRSFDNACLEGVPTMEIHGELHASHGHEAIGAGIAAFLTQEDALVSTHRNHHHALAKGVDPFLLMAEIFEKEDGLCGGYGGHMHPFDPARNFSATGIVGQSLPVALGYAYAFRMRHQCHIAVGATGDGGANQGTFHETLNMAAAWNLPLVVLVENNGYGISVPAGEVSAKPTIAERATAYGIWGRRVDGTDPDEVAVAFEEASKHARSNKGPAVLECTCHRLRGHYEGDADHYRSREERKALRTVDPLQLYKNKLLAAGICAENELDEIAANSRQAMQAVLAEVRACQMPAAALARQNVFRGGPT